MFSLNMMSSGFSSAAILYLAELPMAMTFWAGKLKEMMLLPPIELN
jgi:hypothetical protein